MKNKPHHKKIGIIANCQSQTLALLIRNMLPQFEVAILDVSAPHSRKESVQKDTCEKMADCDFIFVQPNQLPYVNLDHLRQHCEGQVVGIANFFFRGLHPDMCLLGNFEKRIQAFSQDHSIVILDAYLHGRTVQQAAEAFNPDNYTRLGLFDAWQSSLAEMRSRDAFLDVPAAAFVEESVRCYPAFLTMLHPTLRLMHDYFVMVLKLIGLNYDKIDVLKIADPLDRYTIAGVLDIVCEHHKLPYRTTETWRMSPMGRKFVKMPQLAEAFFRAYEKIPPEKLKIHSPVDMVRSLRADALLRFLVDDVPLPESFVPVAVASPINDIIRGQAEREKIKKELPREEFLASIKVEIDFVNVKSVSHPAFAQSFALLNKNNPFSATGGSWTRQDCEQCFKNEWDIVAFSVKDRFADYGIAAVVVVSGGNTIEQFVMSSRILGINVENKIIAWLADLMRKTKQTKIIGRLAETQHNFPCRDLYAQCGFIKEGDVWVKNLS